MKSAHIFVESNAPLFYRIDLISSVELLLNCEMLGHVQFCCNTRCALFSNDNYLTSVAFLRHLIKLLFSEIFF